MMYIRQGIIFVVILAAVFTYDLNVCYTQSSYPGQCISLYECPELLNFINARKATGLTWEERQFVVGSQCFSNIGSFPHVCCNSSDPVLQIKVTTHQPFVGQVQPSDNDGNVLPNPAVYGKCGRDIFSSRIFGGTDTELGEFPWMALLEYENYHGVREFSCGGSLINSRYVLTAAHCLVGRVEQEKGQLINIRLGEHNLNTTEDCEEANGKRICSDPVQDISVDSKIAHPQYLPNDRNQHHDIGLVRLGRVILYSVYIHPICLPPADVLSVAGSDVTVAGWGRTLIARKSAIKQHITIPVFDQQQCRNRFKSLIRTPVDIENTQLCAGGELNRDSCQGDSGGPLMYLKTGVWYVEGIVSFGGACGTEGWPGVYVRVTQYLDWIQSVLEP